jgi:hypothetical protein
VGSVMRKRETTLDWWRDEDGNYFPWLLEMWAWNKAQEAELTAQGKSTSRMASSFDKPKLSDLIACMAAIRAAPEIWEPLQEMAMLYPDTQRTPDNDDKGMAGLISRFTVWFQMKRGLDNMPYSELYTILYDQERGNLPGLSDVEVLRQREVQGSYIDDLEDKDHDHA